MNYLVDFQKLNRISEEKMISGNELSELSGVTICTISKMKCRPNCRFTKASIVKVARALGLDPLELRRGEQ